MLQGERKKDRKIFQVLAFKVCCSRHGRRDFRATCFLFRGGVLTDRCWLIVYSLRIKRLFVYKARCILREFQTEHTRRLEQAIFQGYEDKCTRTFPQKSLLMFS
jgi:hypothetical protein